MDNDPAQAMLAAKADGLLRYFGFVKPNHYEAEAGGRHWTMPAAEALLTVARLRDLDELKRAGAVLELGEIRSDGSHALETSKGLLVLQEQEVIHWCAGYRAGIEGNGQSHAGVDTIGEIMDLFDNPNRDDQLRMVILGLMHGGSKRLRADDLVEMIEKLPGVGEDDAPVKKTVVGALGFGNGMSAKLAGLLLAAFGLKWSLSGPAPFVRADGKPTGPLPEMPGLVRLRELVEVSRRGWLRYTGKEGPNDARWLREYPVSVGEQEYKVGAEALLPWLRGLRAFHGDWVGVEQRRARA